MVDATARTHGVLLQGAQAGHGLARAADARLVASHRLDESRGRGGNAAQVTQEVQRHPLGRQHAARRAGDDGDAVARFDAAAVGPLDPHLDRRIDQTEGQRSSIQAGHDTGLARHQGRLGPRRGGHDRVGGEIAGTAEILQERGTHDRLEHEHRKG